MLSRRGTAARITIQFTALLLGLYLCMAVLLHAAAARVSAQVILSPLISLFPAGVMLYAAYALWHAQAAHAPHAARALAVVGLALFAAALGDLFTLFFTAGHWPEPRLSPGDIFNLLACPAFLLGALLLPARKQGLHEGLKMILDLMIVLIATALVGWDSLIAPLARAAASGAWGEMLRASVSAWNDGLLILAVFWLLYHEFGAGYHRTGLLLAGGGSLLILYHGLYRYLLVTTGVLPGGALVEVIHTASSLLFALSGAAVVVWVRMGGELPAEAEQRPALMGTSWWHYLPYLFVLAAYLLLLQRSFIGMTLSIREIALAFGGIVMLVLLRQFLSLHENKQLYQGLRDVHRQLQQQTVALAQVNSGLQQEILERRRVEARLSYDALHDGLTGLPNRGLFLDRLAQAARKQKRNSQYRYAVLFLDLDSFKVINDSLGHHMGDQLLIRTAQRLQDCIRGTDTLARLGGDEFVVLLEDVGFPEDVILTANRLQSEVSKPILIQDNRVYITVSIGIVRGGEDSGRPEDILRDADLAMYQAKSRGKGRYEIFHTGMRDSAISRMVLENDLRSALENNEFILMYQPIVELPRQRLVGFEALVRWQHPWRGLLPPAEFLPLAEETGMILPLGQWILERACRQAVEWLRAFPGLLPLKMSVNISGTQLKQPGFVHHVVDVLARTHLPPESLALEVTETVCLDSLERVAATLRELQTLGIEAQIDDFGTGYSSLSYLQRLPVYSIKIDRSFIHDLNAAGSSTPDIVRAIFAMVNHLGIKAIAEGIENEAQLDALRRLNCRYVQGFLLAAPMDAQNAERWVQTVQV
ncbi:MAG TPA: EAL domain-containing protein [Anaerolineaceae bacterium]